ncbi:MAG: prepilin-type N-terminal cleavage/methylation domain-containing protein [Bacillota bacterium]
MEVIKDNKGITIIEILVAFTILIVIVASAFNIVNSCFSNLERAGNMSQLIWAGKGIMERLHTNSDPTLSDKHGIQYEEISGIKYDLLVRDYNYHDLKLINIYVYFEGMSDSGVSITTVRLVK